LRISASEILDITQHLKKQVTILFLDCAGHT